MTALSACWADTKSQRKDGGEASRILLSSRASVHQDDEVGAEGGAGNIEGPELEGFEVRVVGFLGN